MLIINLRQVSDLETGLTESTSISKAIFVSLNMIRNQSVSKIYDYVYKEKRTFSATVFRRL